MRDIRASVRHDIGRDESAFSIDMDKKSRSVSADDGIAFPITDTGTLCCRFRPCFNAPDKFCPSLHYAVIFSIFMPHSASLGQKYGQVFPRTLDPIIYGIIGHSQNLLRNLFGGASDAEKPYDSLL